MPSPSETARVGAVVAVKPLAEAKSRFGGPPAFRGELVLAMLVDTVSSLSAILGAVVVVGTPHELVRPLTDAPLRSTPSPPILLPDPGPDLNAAFVVGAQRLLHAGFTNVLACVGDLPTLRPDSLEEFVAASSAASSTAPDAPARFFLRDAGGIGTTMLYARSLATATDLAPGFEGKSASRHEDSGAIDPAPTRWPDARLDVDTPADLLAASQLGVGPATRALLNRPAAPPGQ